MKRLNINIIPATAPFVRVIKGSLLDDTESPSNITSISPAVMLDFASPSSVSLRLRFSTEKQTIY